MEKKTARPWASLDKVALPPRHIDPRSDGQKQDPPANKLTLKDLPKTPLEVDWDPSPVPGPRPVHVPKNTPTRIGLGQIESHFVPPPPVPPRKPLKAPPMVVQKPLEKVMTPPPVSQQPPSSISPPGGIDIKVGDARLRLGSKTWGERIRPWLLPILLSLATSIGTFFIVRYETIKADYHWREKTEESIKVLSGVVERHQVRTKADADELFKIVNDLDRNRVPVLERRVTSVEGLVNMPEDKVKK